MGMVPSAPMESTAWPAGHASPLPSGRAVLYSRPTAAPTLVKEGTPMKKLMRFCRDAMATMAGTVLASVVVRLLDL